MGLLLSDWFTALRCSSSSEVSKYRAMRSLSQFFMLITLKLFHTRVYTSHPLVILCLDSICENVFIYKFEKGSTKATAILVSLAED